MSLCYLLPPHSCLFFSPIFFREERALNLQTQHKKKIKMKLQIHFTSGLRSRCTTPCRWQNATTFSICIMTAFASSSVYFPPLQKEPHNSHPQIITNFPFQSFTFTQMPHIQKNEHLINNYLDNILSKSSPPSHNLSHREQQKTVTTLTPQTERKQKMKNNTSIKPTPLLCRHCHYPHTHHETESDSYVQSKPSKSSPPSSHPQQQLQWSSTNYNTIQTNSLFTLCPRSHID